jgi:hypothetical protein
LIISTAAQYIDLEPSHPKPTGDIVKILDTSSSLHDNPKPDRPDIRIFKDI